MTTSRLILALRHLRTPWVVILLGVLVCGGVASAAWQWHAAREAKRRAYRVYLVHVYYYDLGSGELFVDWSNEIPPVKAPSGPDANNMPQGVRAYVFSCGDCSDESQRFVGWLETYTPEVKQMLLTPRKRDSLQEQEYLDFIKSGHLVRLTDSDAWVPADSEAGFSVTASVEARCGPQGQSRPCFPGTGWRCIETTGPPR